MVYYSMSLGTYTRTFAIPCMAIGLTWELWQYMHKSNLTLIQVVKKLFQRQLPRVLPMTEDNNTMTEREIVTHVARRSVVYFLAPHVIHLGVFSVNYMIKMWIVWCQLWCKCCPFPFNRPMFDCMFPFPRSTML